MAILSSLFGAQQQQPAVGAQPITTSEIPKQLAPYYEDILSKAQALYNKRVEEGFKPYEGPTIAQFTPEQEATFAGIAGLQGQVAPKFAEAEQLTRDAAARITGEQIQEAMSPYQQAVTDIEKRESQKAFEQNVLPKIRAAQIAQGSFGGTRGTLLEAQALGDQQRLLDDIQAKGSQAAFADARRALEAQRVRTGQTGSQLANIAPLATKTISGEIGLQQAVGEDKQRYAQAALDEAYRQFQAEQQEPYDAMQKYQAVVTGAPIAGTQYAAAQPQPSLAQTLIGGLGTAVGAYGAFGGLDRKGKTGGGISTLPVYKRAKNNMVIPDKGFSFVTDKTGNFTEATVQETPGRGKVLVDSRGNIIRNVPFNKDSVSSGMKLYLTKDAQGGLSYTPGISAKSKIEKKEKSDVISSAGLKDLKAFQDIYQGSPSGKASKAAADALAGKSTSIEDYRKNIKALDPTYAELEKGIAALPTREQADATTEKFYADKAQRAKEAQAIDERDTRREQFANMAKFFARLGTASPQTGGIQGLVGAGLKAAEETAPDVIATQTAAKARADERRAKAEERAEKKRAEKEANTMKDITKLQTKLSVARDKNASNKEILELEIALAGEEAKLAELQVANRLDIQKVYQAIDDKNVQERITNSEVGEILGRIPNKQKVLTDAYNEAARGILAIVSQKAQDDNSFKITTPEIENMILLRAKQIIADKAGQSALDTDDDSDDADTINFDKE